LRRCWMMSQQLKSEMLNLETDVLILGTGGAGLRAAIEAKQAGADVLVVSKMGPEDHNCTVRAWGGFSYVPDGQEEEFFRQLVETGGFLNNQRLVEVLARDTPKRLRELGEFGIEMEVLGDADKKNCLGIIKLPGQGRTTGFGMTKPLRTKAEGLGVRFMDNLMVSSLLTDAGRMAGATAALLADGRFVSIASKAVIVATGGGACIYERTDNPDGTTGDGIALAYEAGAELVDMECVSFQFPKGRVRELFDLQEVPDEGMLRLGAAHYFLGGIKIDERCRTTVEGLYAAGEVTGGVMGAARLGGSAMADIVVFGAIAGKEAAEWAKDSGRTKPDADHIHEERLRLDSMLSDKGDKAADVAGKLRAIMWRNCGTMKTRRTLLATEEELGRLETVRRRLHVESPTGLREAIECSNMLTVAKLICKASLIREETRGCFWRLEFPQPDNANWLKNIHMWQANGEWRCEVRPAVMTRLTSPTKPRIGAGCFGYLPQH